MKMRIERAKQDESCESASLALGDMIEVLRWDANPNRIGYAMLFSHNLVYDLGLSVSWSIHTFNRRGIAFRKLKPGDTLTITNACRAKVVRAKPTTVAFCDMGPSDVGEVTEGHDDHIGMIVTRNGNQLSEVGGRRFCATPDLAEGRVELMRPGDKLVFTEE